MNIFLLIIAGVGYIVAFLLYEKNLLKASQLDQCRKQIVDLNKKLGELQAEQEQLVEEDKGKDEFQRLASKIVSQLGYGVICIDEKGGVCLVNNYAEKFIGTSAEGKQYEEVLQKLRIKGKKDFSDFEKALNGKSQSLSNNAEIIVKNEKVPISGSIIPLDSGEEDKIIAFTFTDNSENIARIMEEKAFFSAAAHELRTPLSVIQLTVYLLIKEFNTLEKKKILENLEKIKTATEQLTDLVNDFLNVSRIDQGRLEVEKEPFDMVALMDEVLKELKPLARERKLYINHKFTGEQRIVIGDKTKAKEVLINLVSNAIKYTLRGGLTIIHKEDKGILMTKITDSGSGIDKASQPLLFKRFMQVGGGRRQLTAKSTGLGLYISRKFAQLMGGDVVLEESKPGKGSTFVFSLPFK